MTNIAPLLWFYDELHHRFWPQPGHGRLCRFGTPPPPPSLSFSCLENASFAVCSFGLWLWHRHGSRVSSFDTHDTERAAAPKRCAHPSPRYTSTECRTKWAKTEHSSFRGTNKSFNKSVGVAGRHCMSVSPYVWMTGISNDEDISRQPGVSSSSCATTEKANNLSFGTHSLFRHVLWH